MRKREALALAIFNETYRSMGMDEITSLNYKADKGQIYREIMGMSKVGQSYYTNEQGRSFRQFELTRSRKFGSQKFIP